MSADDFRITIWGLLLVVLVLALLGGAFGPLVHMTSRGENWGTQAHEFGNWRYNAVTIRDYEGHNCLFVMAWKEDGNLNTEWAGTEMECR